MMDLRDTIEVGYGGLVAAESLEAEKFQPVTMFLAIQQFCETFANTFRSVAASEATVVEKETQQIQIIVADMSPQREVISQAAVEVLDNGAGPGCL